MREKKGKTVETRVTYVNERDRNVADMRCFRGGSDSLHKVSN